MSNTNSTEKHQTIDDSSFWNGFYQSHLPTSMSESPFAKFVTTFLADKIGELNIVDLGCGNGRDSLFFASKGAHVIGIDASTIAINTLQKYAGKSISFITGNFTNDERIYNGDVDCFYSRFSIHAVSENDEDELLKNIKKSLKSNGYLFIEVRSIHDEKYGKGVEIAKNTFLLDNHHRRFLRMEDLLTKLIQLGFAIRYAEESRDFAPFNGENPPVIRIIAEGASN
jgi:SAM-dependent methyltransferase